MVDLGYKNASTTIPQAKSSACSRTVANRIRHATSVSGFVLLDIKYSMKLKLHRFGHVLKAVTHRMTCYRVWTHLTHSNKFYGQLEEFGQVSLLEMFPWSQGVSPWSPMVTGGVPMGGAHGHLGAHGHFGEPTSSGPTGCAHVNGSWAREHITCDQSVLGALAYCPSEPAAATRGVSRLARGRRPSTPIVGRQRSRGGGLMTVPPKWMQLRKLVKISLISGRS